MGHLLALLAFAAVAAGPQATTSQRPSTVQDEVNRGEARRHYRAGERFVSLEDFERAAREFRVATELDPAYVLAYYSMGQALMALRRYPEALTAYIDARDTILGQSHMDQGAQAAADQERRDQINELEHTLDKVRSGQLKGTGGANLALETAIEQRLSLLRDTEMKNVGDDPQIPAELSLALGSAYYRQGQLEDAEREYRSAIRRRGDLGAAHNNLAVVYMLTGRFDEAKKEIRTAEEAGFRVSPLFKKDLEEKEGAARETAAK